MVIIIYLVLNITENKEMQDADLLIIPDTNEKHIERETPSQNSWRIPRGIFYTELIDCEGNIAMIAYVNNVKHNYFVGVRVSRLSRTSEEDNN